MPVPVLHVTWALRSRETQQCAAALLLEQSLEHALCLAWRLQRICKEFAFNSRQGHMNSTAGHTACMPPKRCLLPTLYALCSMCQVDFESGNLAVQDVPLRPLPTVPCDTPLLDMMRCGVCLLAHYRLCSAFVCWPWLDMMRLFSPSLYPARLPLFLACWHWTTCRGMGLLALSSTSSLAA